MLHLLVGAISWMECMKCNEVFDFMYFVYCSSLLDQLLWDFFCLVYSLINLFCVVQNNNYAEIHHSTVVRPEVLWEMLCTVLGIKSARQ
jgi:hypothetical protein